MEKTKERMEALWEHFSRVSVLSDKNGCRALRIRHQKTGQDYILHLLPEENPIYETLCRIRHPNLPAVYEIYRCADGMLVLEEYIEGLNVAQVAESGRYRKRGAKKVAEEVCRALIALHEEGFIHRDIKPENVMIGKDGRVVLIDFNAARKKSMKSRDTVIMGTVGFAPPEQLGLSQSDERTDIYALGVLLNILLTGQYPTEGMAGGRLGRIIRRCTRVQAKERYQSAKSLYRALKIGI